MSRSSTLALAALVSVSFLAACSRKEAPPAEAPAAPAAAAEANVHRFPIGEFAAVSLLDGHIEVANDNSVLGVGHTPDDVAAVLDANGLPTDKIRLDVHPLLVKTADRVLLFDTGAGTLFGPTVGHLQEAFAAAGEDPQSVTDIFISHSHGDHVGGLVNAEGAPAFPNATIHLSQPEWAHMSAQENYKALNDAIAAKVSAFAPGAELIPGTVKAVEVKGHTPGHTAYEITSGGESLLYVGDSMHHFAVSVQQPEWTIAFDGDNATATASRVKLISDLAASGQRVFAVHFPFPGIGRLEKHGEGAAWVAE